MRPLHFVYVIHSEMKNLSKPALISSSVEYKRRYKMLFLFHKLKISRVRTNLCDVLQNKLSNIWNTIKVEELHEFNQVFPLFFKDGLSLIIVKLFMHGVARCQELKSPNQRFPLKIENK